MNDYIKLPNSQVNRQWWVEDHKKKETETSFKFDFFNDLHYLNNFHIDEGFFDVDRFGLGDLFFIFLLIEDSGDSNCGSFCELSSL